MDGKRGTRKRKWYNDIKGKKEEPDPIFTAASHEEWR